MGRPDRARDSIDLVPASVNAPGLVEHAILGEDVIDGRSSARGVALPEYLVEIAWQQGRDVVVAERQTVYDMQVSQPEAVELPGDEGELLPVIRRPHIVERAVGREMHADPVSGPDGRDGFDHFLQEAVTVQGAPAVLVGAA